MTDQAKMPECPFAFVRKRYPRQMEIQSFSISQVIDLVKEAWNTRADQQSTGARAFNYWPIQEYAEKHKLDYNELCSLVREAALTAPDTGKAVDAPRIEEGAMQMMARDHARMRKAGTDLAEAALHVINHYDGLHRLSLAVSAWAKSIADEGDRGKRYASLTADKAAEGDAK